RAVERGNGDQVEEDQDEIEKDSELPHLLQDRQRVRRAWDNPSDCTEERYDPREDDGEDEVRGDPRERHDDVPALEVAVIPRVDWYGFRAAEHQPPREERQEREDNSQKRVNVLDRVPGEATEIVRCPIPLFERGIAVRVLMSDHGEQQHGRDEQKAREGFQLRGGGW